jgi:hypothetical protein
MIKAFVGTGVLLESLVASVWYAGSHGASWISVLVGLVATIPIVHRWALAFAYGEAPSTPTLWHAHHNQAIRQ